MSRKLSTEEFITRARKVHGDKYDYSLVEYTTYHKEIKLLCYVHGVFEQRAKHHLNGSGCPTCVGTKKLSTEEFITRARKVHGDKYDYSLVEYKGNKTKVKIICKKHGVFEQTPTNHLSGNSCPTCFGKNKTTKTFIEELQSIHGDRYDYSLVQYRGAYGKIKIICKEHGIFEQIATKHLNGCGCPNCAGTKKLSTEEFITRARKVHGDKYDYSLVEYVNIYNKVKIRCPKHDIFEQIPNDHIHKSYGCPKCTSRISKPEIELQEYIKSIYPHLVITNSRAIIYPYELDIYLPDINLAIEFNGDYWHSSEDAKRRDKETKRLCKESGIRLMIVWERYWNDNKSHLQHAIRKIINKFQ